ncbi:spinster family MFS transporter [Sphingopyxis panaciterrae]
MLGFVLSYTDRQVISLLVEPIKADLGISDTQFGLLQGLAFSLFYALVGIPISGLADRKSRPMIIACGIAVWSAATCLCGFAKSFGTMLIARMGVGAGEATLSPATYSLIADLFPPEERGRPLGVFSLGSFLGAGFAFLVGGAAIAALSAAGPFSFFGIDLRPWQLVLIAAGAPGFILAAVIALTVRDPHRSAARAAETLPGWGEVLAFVMRHKAIFAPHIAGYAFYSICLFGLLSWSPAYLMRVHHLSPQDAGFALGIIAIIANGGGVLFSGALLDRRTRAGHEDGPLRVGVFGALGTLLPLACLPFLEGLYPCLAALAAAMFFASWPMPPSAALIQRVATSEMRSRVSAVFLFVLSLIGMGGGAVLIGLLNDRLFPGPAGVGSSLAVVAGGGAALAAVVLALGIAPLRAFARRETPAAGAASL